MGCGQAGFEMNRETLARNRLERERDIYAWSSAWQIMTTRINWGSNILSTLILHMFLSPRWQPPTRPLSHWGKNSVAMVPQLKSWCWICLGALEQRGEWWKVGMIRWGKHPFFPIKLAPPRMEFRNLNPKQQVLHWGPKKWDKPALDFYCIVIVGYILSGFFAGPGGYLGRCLICMSTSISGFVAL